MQCFPFHLTPRGFALASPLPLVPRAAPRPMPPLPAVPPPLLSPELGLAGGAGVANFDDLDDTGGFSTKEVSVVLMPPSQFKFDAHAKSYLHECSLSIEFTPPVFIPALPHHPLCVLVLPRPRKRLFDRSLCQRVSQWNHLSLSPSSAALPSSRKQTHSPPGNPRKRHSCSARTESLRSSR